MHAAQFTAIAATWLLMGWVTVDPARAQPPLTPAPLLTFDQAIKLGLAQSKQLKVSQTRVASADARSQESRDGRVPQVSVGATYNRLSDNVVPFQIQLPGSPEAVALNPQILNQYALSATVVQHIFGGFRQKYAAESAQFLAQAARLDYQKDRSDVVLNIASAYYNLYKIEASRQLVQENLRQLAEQLTTITNLEAQGLAIGNDVLRTRLQRANIEQSQLDIENSYRVASYNLALMLGLPTDAPLRVDTTTLATPRAVQPFDDYLTQALGARQDLKAFGVRSQAATSNLSAMRSGYYPTLNLVGNYLNARPNQRLFPVQDRFFATWTLGLNFNYNLSGIFTNKHQLADARATVAQNQANYELLTDNVRMEVNQQYLALTQSREKITLAQRTVDQARENYRTTQSRYGNGVALLTDLLDANTLLLQAQINQAITRADAELAYQRLLKATGNNLF